MTGVGCLERSGFKICFNRVLTTNPDKLQKVQLTNGLAKVGDLLFILGALVGTQMDRVAALTSERSHATQRFGSP